MSHSESAPKDAHHCCCRDKAPAIRGFLVPCLLVLLKEAPAHGYQLMELLEHSGYLNEIPDPGVVYRHLRRLEQEGMVTSSFEPGDGPARKVYTLTGLGRESLTAWIDDLRQLKLGLDHFLSIAGDEDH